MRYAGVSKGRRRVGVFGLLSAVAIVLAVGGSQALAAQFHGVTPLKVCLPNTAVGAPLLCSFKLTNSDSFGDTVTISSIADAPAIRDVVAAGGGADASGDLLSSPLVFSPSAANEPPTCTGGSGAGTLASPYVGATACSLPGEHVLIGGQDFGAGASIETIPVSHHTVTVADYNVSGHLLTDQVTFHWRAVCESGQSCPIGQQSIQSGGSSNVVDANVLITPPTATNAVGTNHLLTITVHSLNGTLQAGPHTATASIAGGPGGFVGSPTCTYTGGAATASCTVTISSATTGTTVVAATADIPVVGPSPGPAVTVTRATNTAANTAAGGSGNAQKAWVDANIQINPPTADNPVGTTHLLTITVNGINGTLGAGTATASIVSGPGSFVGGLNTCNYTGGVATASCTVTITSVVSGTTVVSATSNITVAGESITRTTNTAANTASGGSGNAAKNWTSLESGRVTGGGSIFATVNGVPNVRVTHGFELRCDPKDKRQSLEINWDGGNNFHLDKIINSVVCFDDPTTQPPPPPGTAIDTYAGNTLFNGKAGFHGFGYAVGTGTCNKQPATIYFILIDAGEPGTEDTAEYHIVSSGCTLDAGPAQLLKGNHQFHKN